MITEMSMHELTDTELDAVSGGFLDFFNDVIQANIVGVQLGAQAIVLGSTLAQAIQQQNNSNI